MMTNRFILFSQSMFLILLFIGVIFWFCEDNNSVANQVCCVDGLIDESKISNNAICTDEYQPVCGCNGITYGLKVNVTRYKTIRGRYYCV